MQYSTIQYSTIPVRTAGFPPLKGRHMRCLWIFKAASIVTGGIANIKSLRPFTGWRLIFFKGGKCSVRKSIHKS